MNRSNEAQWTRAVIIGVGLLVLAAAGFRAAPALWPVVKLLIVVALVTPALNDLVHWQVKRKAPRWLAVANLVLLLLMVGTVVLYFLVPPLVAQTRALITAAPGLWEAMNAQISRVFSRYPELAASLDLNAFVRNLLVGADSAATTVRAVFSSTVNVVAAFILLVALIIYALLNPWPLLYGLRGLFPGDWWPTLDALAHSVARRIRAWVIGTVILGLVVGVLDYVGLTILNVFFRGAMPFVLLFAIIGGALEVLPVIGPVVAAVLPTLVGLSIHPLLGVLVLGVFVLVQQLENFILAPIIMGKALDLHPVSLLVSLVTLSALLGVFGAIIAVPVASLCKVLYDEWYYPQLHHGHPPSPPPRVDDETRADTS
jgi:predicted PurR-regulated permease PerM